MSTREESRKKRRLRNLVSLLYCSLQLLIVLLLFQGAGKLLSGMQDEQTIVPAFQAVVNDQDEQENRNTQDEPVICIDAGHGGKDQGSDYKNRLEKDDNLALALALQAYLEEKGTTVIMTREDDTFLKLSERCSVANNSNADYLISLHRNDGDGYGVETWVCSEASEETLALAGSIMDGLETVGIQKNRGVKKGSQKSASSNYYITGNAAMPACIVELGFIDNAKDNTLFDAKRTEYVAAIGDAILSTWSTYRKSNMGQTDGTESSDNVDGTLQTGRGQILTNAQIEDVTLLDNTLQDWGIGKNTDDSGRPVDVVKAQEMYGGYNACFIGDETDVIYLTFDEGYEYGYTASILDTLKQKNVKAVFFVTEPYAKAEPELVERIIEEGHVLGNHSATHPVDGIASLSIEQQQNEVMENHQYIKEQFDYNMYLFRYPAGKFSEQSLAIVNNCNYKSVFWSFAYLDYDVENQPEQAESLSKMLDRLHPGAVYLLHAESETNAIVLGEFIDKAMEQGYSFGTL
jgi:delta-lactam-biosynthetic de-N-acetylase